MTQLLKNLQRYPFVRVAEGLEPKAGTNLYAPQGACFQRPEERDVADWRFPERSIYQDGLHAVLTGRR